jgi:polyisoprenoid-binding protein YceI
MYPIRRCLVLTLICLLASCVQAPKQSELPPTLDTPRAVDTRGAALYAIDPRASDLHILVFRGGTLARLGHNHVVSSESLSGRVWLHRDFARSGFEIAVPVESLIIDDPMARAAHGEAFAANVPQKDIDGTRRNMMKPEVLDGEHFPEIKLSSSTVAGTSDKPKIMARITIKSVTRELPIPMNLKIDESRLEASGELDILQSEFGMKPFSVGLGALEVQDRLHLTYRIEAIRAKDVAE